jgi:hypothetical protein
VQSDTGTAEPETRCFRCRAQRETIGPELNWLVAAFSLCLSDHVANQLSHAAISPFERLPFGRRCFFRRNESNLASLDVAKSQSRFVAEEFRRFLRIDTREKLSAQLTDRGRPETSPVLPEIPGHSVPCISRLAELRNDGDAGSAPSQGWE